MRGRRSSRIPEYGIGFGTRVGNGERTVAANFSFRI